MGEKKSFKKCTLISKERKNRFLIVKSLLQTADLRFLTCLSKRSLSSIVQPSNLNPGTTSIRLFSSSIFIIRIQLISASFFILSKTKCKVNFTIEIINFLKNWKNFLIHLGRVSTAGRELPKNTAKSIAKWNNTQWNFN